MQRKKELKGRKKNRGRFDVKRKENADDKKSCSKGRREREKSKNWLWENMD